MTGFGNKTIHSIGYEEFFSPVARYDTLRLLLSLCAAEKMHSRRFDIKTAFLHGDLKEDLYCTQPPGFSDGSKKVCRLHKAVRWQIRVRLTFEMLQHMCIASTTLYVIMEENKIASYDTRRVPIPLS